MTLRLTARALAMVFLLCAAVAPLSAAETPVRGKGKKSAAAEPDPDAAFRRDLPDPPAPGTLPDDYVILQVGDKKVTARRYTQAYFNAYPVDRPAQDSLGRVEFLRTLIHKELLAAEARRINKPLTFENRQELREHAARVYSNVLYQRVAVDPVKVSDEEVRDAYEVFKIEARLRHILFAGRETAERVRRELMAGRIGWNLALQQYSIGDRSQGGDLGWQAAAQLGLGVANVTHRLKPGEYSRPVRNADGWTVFQCVETRPVNPPAFEAIQRLIRGQLEMAATNMLADALQDTLAAQIALVVDTTNVRWAVAQFPSVNSYESTTGTLSINAALPEIAPADTARVLARFRGGQLTLGSFLHEYGHIPPMLRPNINEFGLLRQQVIATTLTPFTERLAVERGIDKDPAAVATVEHKREEVLVGHLYEDSVSSRVSVGPADMRRYYNENRHRFVTVPIVRFAAITRPNRAAMDSVAARLRAGETAEDILRADSLAGRESGSIRVRRMNDLGQPYHKLLFEDLRQGQFEVQGPDQHGDYILIQVVSRDDGRQLSYEEAQQWIEESLGNEQAEKHLNALLRRLISRTEIRWRPDLVMRTDFRDRSL